MEKTNYLFGMLFSVAALYHLVGIFFKINDASIFRHVLFVVIDIYCVYGFLYRHNLFIIFLSILTIQQIYTHGLHLFVTWDFEQKIHWISVAVLILMPLGMIKVIREYFTD